MSRDRRAWRANARQAVARGELRRLMRPDELQAEQARPATARPAPDREQRPELRMGLAELLGAALRGPA